MDRNRPIVMVRGQLPPVQLPDPPAKRGRKAQSQGGPARKRSKKADGADGATSAPEAAAASGKPPSGRRGGKAGGGRAKSSKQQEKEDDGLELVAGEETKVEEEPEEKLGKTHSGVFSKDLPWLMYGFGDAHNPIKETVDLVEDIAMQFVTETVHTAMAAAALRTSTNATGGGGSKQKKDLDENDLMYALRRDPRKVARIQDLRRRQKEIIEARKAMDVEKKLNNEQQQWFSGDCSSSKALVTAAAAAAAAATLGAAAVAAAAAAAAQAWGAAAATALPAQST